MSKRGKRPFGPLFEGLAEPLVEGLGHLSGFVRIDASDLIWGSEVAEGVQRPRGKGGRPKGSGTVTADKIVRTWRELREARERNPTQAEMADALDYSAATGFNRRRRALNLPWPIE